MLTRLIGCADVVSDPGEGYNTADEHEYEHHDARCEFEEQQSEPPEATKG
jgi:hypothetical protein